MKEIMFTSKLDDTKKIKDLKLLLKAYREGYIG